MSYTRRTKDELARRVAQDIYDGAYVNLGIGQPTLVANHLPPGIEVVLHSENGILGMGPAPAQGEEDYDIINAGKQPVTLLPGGVYFHHADSFAMMRGGHLDICVLGAFQVSATGDLANWSTGEPGSIPAVGGAMDLAIGAKQTWVMMDLLTKKGESKVVPQGNLAERRALRARALAPSSAPRRMARSWPQARKRARSTANITCSNTPSMAMWPWSRPRRATAGATSPTACRRATSAR